MNWDSLPIIGRTPQLENVYLASGHNMLGMSLATVTGKLIAELMSGRWEKMFANQLSVDEFKALAADTRAFFQQAPGKLKTTNDQLTEIILAQDFQDLTGQVIKKVVEMAEGLETQLLQALIEVMPEERRAEAPEGLLNGPVIKSHGGTDEVGFKGALGLGYEIARNKVMDKIAEGMRRFPTLNAAPAEAPAQEIEAKPA